ncbi:hypothetical protein SB781_40225, partial [Paraburkholderia sp. SIMBA_061]
MSNKDLYNYRNFVDRVTSTESKDYKAFEKRTKELHNQGINIPRFITGATGLGDESSEVQGLMKKMIFQGKPFN